MYQCRCGARVPAATPHTCSGSHGLNIYPPVTGWSNR